MDQNVRRTLLYHERTKHHLQRYAPSPGYMDWENEPSPYRNFEGASLVRLPLLEQDPDEGFDVFFDRSNKTPEPFTLAAFAAFLELSMGLSAWKSIRGSSWALRMNPSSGNLHPTEAYLLLPSLAGDAVSGGLYHYRPFVHCLEERATIGETVWSEIRGHFGTDCFIAGLSSIHWRQAWKYGERAFRYCNHDIGHALACMGFSASLLGWRISYLGGLSDDDTSSVLGINRTPWDRFETEVPGPMILVHPVERADMPREMPLPLIDALGALDLQGQPNQLSKEHINWDAVKEAAEATWKPRTPFTVYPLSRLPRPATMSGLQKGAAVIRRRRSAQAMDPSASLALGAFLDILDRTLPRSDAAPFDCGLGRVSIHLFIFVHSVEGLQPGLYFLLRDPYELDELRAASNPAFLWHQVHGCPAHLPLFFLQAGDFRTRAALVNCRQDIAGNSVFSLSMIARFRERVCQAPFLYRCLFWEAGIIGQILYLSAEAHGMQGTGIGCYFDDLVHELLGLRSNEFQSLYNFTIGKALVDSRVTTLPAYHHLGRT